MLQNSRIPLRVTNSSCLIVLEGKVLDDLMANPRPILWNREGLYSWIPAVRVRNSVNILKDEVISKKNNNDLTALQLVYTAVSTKQLIGANKELAQGTRSNLSSKCLLAPTNPWPTYPFSPTPTNTFTVNGHEQMATSKWPYATKATINVTKRP